MQNFALTENVLQLSNFSLSLRIKFARIFEYFDTFNVALFLLLALVRFSFTFCVLLLFRLKPKAAAFTQSTFGIVSPSC